IKKIVGLSPIVIILAALIGFELGGFWGVLLAIPTAVILVEFTNDLEKHKAFIRSNDEKK
ncbi:MAG: AI-2E family transporter, partial [Candidatus Paceibacterota bacterium]